MYERTGEEEHQAISNMISLPAERSYSSHLVSVGHASDPHPLSLPQMHPPVLYPSASVSSQSVRNLYSVQCPPGRNLQSLLQVSAGGTLKLILTLMVTSLFSLETGHSQGMTVVMI